MYILYVTVRTLFRKKELYFHHGCSCSSSPVDCPMCECSCSVWNRDLFLRLWSGEVDSEGDAGREAVVS